MSTINRRRVGPKVVAAVSSAAVGVALAACSTTSTTPAAVKKVASTRAAPSTSTSTAGTTAQSTTTTSVPPSTTSTVPPSQVAALAAKGVGCAPLSVGSLPMSPPLKPLRFTARLGRYVATVTGVQPTSFAGVPLYEYESPLLTVAGPSGRFHISLGGTGSHGVSRLSPTGVGPTSLDSPLCLVRFDGSKIPTVLIGAGGPQMTLASAWAYDVAVSITSTGLTVPVSDLSTMNGAAGLGGAGVVFVHGRPLLLGLNGAFGYQGAFTSQPPIVLDVAGGEFVDVTRFYPALVASSAPGFWRSWVQSAGHKPPADSIAVPALTAWAAVECVIGRQSSAEAKLSSLHAAGWLTTSTLRSIQQELVDTGYCKRPS